MYYVYVLQSQKSGRLYVGSSDDLKARLLAHNAGKVKSTKPYAPYKIIYYEAHRNKTLARTTELFYKTSQGKRQLYKKLGLA